MWQQRGRGVGAGQGGGVLADRNAHVALGGDRLVHLLGDAGRERGRIDTGLAQGLRELGGVDVDILHRAVFRGLLDELLERRRAALVEFRVRGQIVDLLEKLGGALGLLAALGVRGHAIGHGLHAGRTGSVRAGADNGRDQGLRGSTRALDQVLSERLLRVEHRPLVEVLQDGRDLLARDLGRELREQGLREAGLAGQVFEQLDRRQFLGGVFDHRLRGGEAERLGHADALLAGLAIGLAAGDG